MASQTMAVKKDIPAMVRLSEYLKVERKVVAIVDGGEYGLWRGGGGKITGESVLI